MALLKYQRAWINDDSRYKVGMFCRQSGKTFTSTLEVVKDCVEKEIAGQRSRWIILSRGERQAKEAMAEGVVMHCQKMGADFARKEIPFFADASYSSLEVTFPGGSRITALPANADTARGFSANVFLDEFAFHQDSRKIWQSLFPVISAGHRILVMSTPNGKGNKFYDIMTGTDTFWSRHTVDIHTAVEAGLDRNVTELKSALNDDDAWSQEYELQWLDEASSWLPYELLQSCIGTIGKYTDGLCYVGVDIAIRSDLFVVTVCELVSGILVVREIIARQRISFAEQDIIVGDVLKRYRVVSVYVDQTGIGERSVEELQNKFGLDVVTGVNFSQKLKQEMAVAAKTVFENRTITIPNDPQLIADLHKIKKQYTATGMPQYIADRDSTGHADRAWSLFLAIYAYEMNGGSLAHGIDADFLMPRDNFRELKISQGVGWGIMR